MKKFLYCAIALFGAAAFSFAFLNNGKPQERTFAFSHASGFYDEPFLLTITAPTDEIYYTLDGSEPSKNSLRYEKPLLIDDASKNQNAHSMRMDVSTGFYEDKIMAHNAQTPPQYKAPDYKIDKCTVLRAVYYDVHGKAGEIKTASYFVGFRAKRGYDGMNVVSLVTSPENLFDYEKGIYVTGKIFDDYFAAESSKDPADYIQGFTRWWWWDSNYHQSGKGWEREAVAAFFAPNGSLLLEQDCGVRVQGGMSRSNNPKSLALHARKQYGKKYFDHDFFATGKNPRSIVLFSGGNDGTYKSGTKMRDYLMSRICRGLDFATFNYVPAVLFLNGEYWGAYLLCEKYDEFFCRNNYGVSAKDVIMIKSGGVEAGASTDRRYYEEMLNFISYADFSDPANYQKACGIIDMHSFMEYFAAQIYISRCGDWPGGNFALWRTRIEDSSSPYADKKWRWMLFDANSSGISAELVDFDSIASTKELSTMFRNLCTSADFRIAFVSTMNRLMNTVFPAEKVSAEIDLITQEMAVAMQANNRRFFGAEAQDEYLSAVEDIRRFFAGRRQYMEALLEEHFQQDSLPHEKAPQRGSGDGGN